MIEPQTKQKIKALCQEITRRLERVHLRPLPGEGEPVLMVSDRYCGVWLEHVYDGVFYGEMNPAKGEIAKNTLRLFLFHQKEDGQLPCYLRSTKGKTCVGYTHIQECVSFGQMCLRVWRQTKDRQLLEDCYTALQKWCGWLQANRRTLGTPLIELFVGYDTGHDNSGRLEGLSCKGSYAINGEPQNAAVLPPDEAAPILAVDMNANYFGNLKALAEMAALLNRPEEGEQWCRQAKEVKEALFRYCYNEETAFFYDADRHLQKRSCRSSAIFHLFMEKVLDPEEDKELIETIYRRYIKNPKEFWTVFPFPSVSVSDPSFGKHTQSNCWGYFSQALTALRCTLWMEDYGWSEDLDLLCEKWLSAWTNCADTFRFGQELDPFSGKPSPCSEWYSSCMLFYLYGAKRIGIIS